MGKVNYPWWLTKNKIITLFPLPMYKLEATRQGRKSESRIAKGQKKTLKGSPGEWPNQRVVESKRDQWPASCEDGIMRTGIILPLTPTLRDEIAEKYMGKRCSDIRQQCRTVFSDRGDASYLSSTYCLERVSRLQHEKGKPGKGCRSPWVWRRKMGLTEDQDS